MAGKGETEVVDRIEGLRWWEGEEMYAKTVQATDENLFNERSRQSFAKQQLEALSRQTAQRQVREFYQLLGVIAYGVETTGEKAQLRSQTNKLHRLLEYVAQSPVGNPQQSLWVFCEVMFDYQHEVENADEWLEEVCKTKFSGTTQKASTSTATIGGGEPVEISSVAAIAIKNLSKTIFASQALTKTLASCPEFLDRCPAKLLLKMAEQNPEVASFILSRKKLVDRMTAEEDDRNAFYQLVTMVAEKAWSDEEQHAKTCRRAIYRLLNDNPALFLGGTPSNIRFILQLDWDSKSFYMNEAQTKMNLALSHFFLNGRAFETLSNTLDLFNLIDPNLLLCLVESDYRVARAVFSDPKLRERLPRETEIRKVNTIERVNLLTHIADRYPHSLFLTHSVIASPVAIARSKKVNDINLESQKFTGAIAMLEGDEIESMPKNEEGEIISLEGYAGNIKQLLLEVKAQLEEKERLEARRRGLLASKKDTEEIDAKILGVNEQITEVATALSRFKARLDELNGLVDPSKKEKEEWQQLHELNSKFRLVKIDFTPPRGAASRAQISAKLGEITLALAQLRRERDGLLPQYQLSILSGGVRASTKPLTEEERKKALDRYFLSSEGGCPSPAQRWYNVEDLYRLKGHYRTLIESQHVIAMFALANEQKRFDLLMKFSRNEKQFRDALLQSKLFEHSAASTQFLESEAIKCVRAHAYGKRSYFVCHPFRSAKLFSGDPKLCQQLFYRRSDEFVRVIKAMVEKGLDVKTFLNSQASWIDGKTLLRIAPQLNTILPKAVFDSYFGWGIGNTPKKLLEREAKRIARTYLPVSADDAAAVDGDDVVEDQSLLMSALKTPALFQAMNFSLGEALDLHAKAGTDADTVAHAIAKQDSMIGRIVGNSFKYLSYFSMGGSVKTPIQIAVGVKGKIKEQGGYWGRASVAAEAFHSEKFKFDQAEWQHIVTSGSRFWEALIEPGFWNTLFNDRLKPGWHARLKTASPFCKAALEHCSLFELIKKEGGYNYFAGFLGEAVVRTALIDSAITFDDLSWLYQQVHVDLKTEALAEARRRAEANRSLVDLLNSSDGAFISTVLADQGGLLNQLVQLPEEQLKKYLTLKPLLESAAVDKSTWRPDLWFKLIKLQLVENASVPSEIVLSLFKRRNHVHFADYPDLFKSLFQEGVPEGLILSHLRACFDESGKCFTDDEKVRSLILTRVTELFNAEILIKDPDYFREFCAPFLVINHEPLHKKILGVWTQVDAFELLDNSAQFSLFISPYIDDAVFAREAWRFGFLLADEDETGRRIRSRLTARTLYQILQNNYLPPESVARAAELIKRDCPLLGQEMLLLATVDHAFVKRFHPFLTPITDIAALTPGVLMKFFDPITGQLPAELCEDFYRACAASPEAVQALLITDEANIELLPLGEPVEAAEPHMLAASAASAGLPDVIAPRANEIKNVVLQHPRLVEGLLAKADELSGEALIIIMAGLREGEKREALIAKITPILFSRMLVAASRLEEKLLVAQASAVAAEEDEGARRDLQLIASRVSAADRALGLLQAKLSEVWPGELGEAEKLSILIYFAVLGRAEGKTLGREFEVRFKALLSAHREYILLLIQGEPMRLKKIFDLNGDCFFGREPREAEEVGCLYAHCDYLVATLTTEQLIKLLSLGQPALSKFIFAQNAFIKKLLTEANVEQLMPYAQLIQEWLKGQKEIVKSTLDVGQLNKLFEIEAAVPAGEQVITPLLFSKDELGVAIARAQLEQAMSWTDEAQCRVFVERNWNFFEPLLLAELKAGRLNEEWFFRLMRCEKEEVKVWLGGVAQYQRTLVEHAFAQLKEGETIASHWQLYLPYFTAQLAAGNFTVEQSKKFIGVDIPEVKAFLATIYFPERRGLFLSLLAHYDGATVVGNPSLFAPMLLDESLGFVGEPLFTAQNFAKYFDAEGRCLEVCNPGMERLAAHPDAATNPFKRLVAVAMAEEGETAVKKIIPQNPALIIRAINELNEADWPTAELSYLFQFPQVAEAILAKEKLRDKLLQQEEKFWTQVKLKEKMDEWLRAAERTPKQEGVLIAIFGHSRTRCLFDSIDITGLKFFAEHGDDLCLTRLAERYFASYLESDLFSEFFGPANAEDLRRYCIANPSFAMTLFKQISKQDNDRARALLPAVFLEGEPSLLSQRLLTWLQTEDTDLIKSIFNVGLKQTASFKGAFQAIFNAISPAQKIELLNNPHFVQQAFRVESLTKEFYSAKFEEAYLKLVFQNKEGFWLIAKADNPLLSTRLSVHFSSLMKKKEVKFMEPCLSNPEVRALLDSSTKGEFRKFCAKNRALFGEEFAKKFIDLYLSEGSPASLPAVSSPRQTGLLASWWKTPVKAAAAGSYPPVVKSPLQDERAIGSSGGKHRKSKVAIIDNGPTY